MIVITEPDLTRFARYLDAMNKKTREDAEADLGGARDLDAVADALDTAAKNASLHKQMQRIVRECRRADRELQKVRRDLARVEADVLRLARSPFSSVLTASASTTKGLVLALTRAVQYLEVIPCEGMYERPDVLRNLARFGIVARAGRSPGQKRKQWRRDAEKVLFKLLRSDPGQTKTVRALLSAVDAVTTDQGELVAEWQRHWYESLQNDEGMLPAYLTPRL